MVCKKCGTKFSDGLFCPECGTRVILNSNSEEQGADGKWDIESFAKGEYDTNKYGPQGQLEEQKITGNIKVGFGAKKVFESKTLIFEQGISIEENAVLEFRNCNLVIEKETAIWIRGKNVRIDFENCCFEGSKGIISGYGDYDDIKLEFRNCALSFKVGNDGLIKACGNVYFENCYIRSRCICELSPANSSSKESTIEFRNCIVVGSIDGELYYSKHAFVYASKAVVEFKNCFIKNSMRLVSYKGGRYYDGDVKVLIENTYFDSNSFTLKSSPY